MYTGTYHAYPETELKSLRHYCRSVEYKVASLLFVYQYWTKLLRNQKPFILSKWKCLLLEIKSIVIIILLFIYYCLSFLLHCNIQKISHKEPGLKKWKMHNFRHKKLFHTKSGIYDTTFWPHLLPPHQNDDGFMFFTF